MLKEEHASEALKELHRCWEVLHPMLYGSLFVSMLMFILLASLWMPPGIPGLYLTGAVPYFCYLVLLSIGYARGLARLRKETSMQITYADLRERRSSDYSSPLFRWLPMLFIVAQLVSALLAMPYLRPALPIPLPYGGTLGVTTWIVGLVFIAMIVVIVFTEVQIAAIVAFPRILVIADPEEAYQVDDMFRAKAIGELQGYELMTLFYFGIIANELLRAALSSSAPDIISTCITVVFVLTLLVSGGVMVAFASRGRAGGTLSGWTWQKRIRKGLNQ